MDFSRNKKRMNVEDDRLSCLSDDLIHKIFSSMDTKHVVQTSAFSSRWRFIWTSMPYLNFSTEGFPTFPKFKEFVTRVFSCRNNLVDVFSIKLRYCGKLNKVCFKKIMKYAVSHNIQQLNITFVPIKKVEFPISLFSSQSLKHLSLTKEPICPRNNHRDLCLVITMSTGEFPALTTLNLDNVALCCDDKTVNCDGLFSKCANLKNLTLKRCKSYESKSLSICHPLLSTLTIEYSRGSWRFWKGLNVVAPQLKNLTICNLQCEHQYLISAPDLKILVYKGYFPLQISTEGFHALEKADICVYGRLEAPKIVRLFEQIQSVKFLTLNLEIIEFLSSSVELISNHSSPFANLKSLKIHPVNKLSEEEQKNVKKMSTDVKKFLLDSSPSATLTMVSREDFTATENTKLGQTLMAELQVLLEQEKVTTDPNKEPMEIKMQAKIGGTTAQIRSCWNDLSAQIEQKKKKAFLIISRLEDIERLLTKLPASNRAMIQPCFSSLFSEVDVVMNKLTDRVETHFNENRSRLSLCFRGPART